MELIVKEGEDYFVAYDEAREYINEFGKNRQEAVARFFFTHNKEKVSSIQHIYQKED